MVRGDRPAGRDRRVGVVVVGVLAGLVLLVGPAAAHVEVSAEPARAGAKDAVITFVAEAESTTAGIRSIQVQLPQGIAPADVTWQSGPPGWSLTATADGYQVSGPALAAGQEARYAIRVRQLPDAPSVAFKTLQTYTDGRIDRWLELPGPGGGEPEKPAPLIALAPATPTTTTAATPASSAPAPAQPATPAPSDRGGLSALAWVGVAVLAAVVVVAGVVVVRRRTRART